MPKKFKTEKTILKECDAGMRRMRKIIDAADASLKNESQRPTPNERIIKALEDRREVAFDLLYDWVTLRLDTLDLIKQVKKDLRR